MTELPDGWTMVTVRDAGEVSLGRQRAPKYHYGDSMRPYLRVANVFEDRIDTTDVMQMHFSDEEFERYRLRPGDVLLNEGQSPHLLGRPAIYRGQPSDVAFTNSLIRFRAGPSVTPEWALAVFRHHLHSRRFMRESRITTNIAHLSASRFGGVEFPIPPLAEQERIVAAIEAQFSRVDAGVAALDRALQNLKRMRDVIRFAATRGQLVSQDPDDEPAASLIERVKPTGRFRGDIALPRDLGPIPKGWSWALMGRLARRITVGHVGPMKDEYVSAGIPFLRSQNVREDRFESRGLLFISPLFHDRLSKSRLMPGDVVIVRSGDVGTACVVPDSLGEANCADLVIVQGPEAIDGHYASMYMNSLARSRVRAGRVGVALTHFNTQSVAELPVPVPPLAEQKRIVGESQRLMSVVDSLETITIAATQRSTVLRSSILKAAFSGRLAHQDPDDEPASLVLERVAATQSALSGNIVARDRAARSQGKVTA